MQLFKSILQTPLMPNASCAYKLGAQWRGLEVQTKRNCPGCHGGWGPHLCLLSCVALLAHLSTGFPRQEYWSGLP